jgi:hypothetical protein
MTLRKGAVPTVFNECHLNSAGAAEQWQKLQQKVTMTMSSKEQQCIHPPPAQYWLAICSMQLCSSS